MFPKMNRKSKAKPELIQVFSYESQQNGIFWVSASANVTQPIEEYG